MRMKTMMFIKGEVLILAWMLAALWEVSVTSFMQ